MPLYFRYATEDDAQALHDLIQSAFAEYIDTIPVPPGALGDTLEDAHTAALTGRTLLAFDVLYNDAPETGDDQLAELGIPYPVLVGTARYEPRESYLYVGRVAVHPQYRRSGIGKALMEHIEIVARTTGYTRLHLGTRASMPGNLAFYKRLGYQVVSEEPHPRGPDVNVWFEKTIPSILGYMILDLPIICRYSNTELTLEGSSSALAEFASIIRRDLRYIDVVLEIPDSPASPYDGYLQIVYVRLSVGLVNIQHDREILAICGSADNLHSLSQNISFVARQIESAPESGVHLLINDHPVYYYRDPASVPLVIKERQLNSTPNTP